jgi:hypothetical protein
MNESGNRAGPVDGVEPDPVFVPDRRVRVAAVAALGSFATVLSAVEAAALRGQIDFGCHVLQLRGAWLAIPPAALDGGILVAATLTLWAVLTGDSATLPRLMTVGLISAAAYANYQGAKHAGRSTLAADYLAGASVTAYLLWHTILTRVRRTDLRRAGALDAPLPRFRLLRWIVAFSETCAAFRLAVRHGITRPDEALKRARLQAAHEIPAADHELDPEELVSVAAGRGGKRRAVEHAAAVLGAAEPTRAQQWLADRGVNVDLSYISRTFAKLNQSDRNVLPPPGKTCPELGGSADDP